MNLVQDIRQQFVGMLERGALADDGNLELLNVSFVADEETIFGTLDQSWLIRERRWYISQSLNVNDIPEPIPAIWKQVATPSG